MSIEHPPLPAHSKATETNMQAFRYTAIIRTFNSFPLVETVVDSLRKQSFPPECIVVVDSGSSPEDCTRLRSMADVFMPYPDEPFNFSKAINIGVEHVETPYILIISSHYVIDDRTLIDRSIRASVEENAKAFFVTNSCHQRTKKTELMTAKNFNGGNGFSNSCGFAEAATVKGRPFREEVFSCEDQEWASWYIRECKKPILKISDPGIRYLNPKKNLVKLLNEELALAYFVDRSRLSIKSISLWILRGAYSLAKFDFARANFKFRLAWELIKARRSAPQKKSRYF